MLKLNLDLSYSHVMFFCTNRGILTKKSSLKKLLMKTAFLVGLVFYKRPADLCNLQVVEGFWQPDMRGFTCQPLGIIPRNF